MKKDGGEIRNWQLHHLSFSKEDLERAYPGQNAQPIVFTGTVVYDPLGRLPPGFHMRSSFIVSIDRDKGVIETINTIYRMRDEGGDTFGDLGDDVLRIFY